VRIFFNNIKAADVERGSLLKPLVGINIDTTNRKLAVSSVFHKRIAVYNDGSVITIVFGWNYPKHAIFLHPTFPFINYYKSKEGETVFKEDE